jgi:PAS domain S-box-containing protein
MNDAGAKLFAFTDPEELIGKQLMDIVHPSSHKAAEKWAKKAYKEGAPTTLIEEQVVRLDGQKIHVEVSGAPIIYQGIQSTQLVIRDITERNRMEDLLRKLQKAVETTEVGVTISNSEGRIVYVNPAEAVMHGYTVDELIGQPSNIFATPEFRKDKAITKQDFEKLSDWKRERINVRKDGSVFPVRLISNPIYDEKEELVGRVTICEDITKRKHAEQSLKKSEKRYRSIFKNATIGIFQATPEGRFLTANPALARMLGYSSTQDIIKTVTNIAEQVYVEPHHWHEITDIARMIQEEVRVETRCRDKDGREITVYLNLWAVRDERDEVHYFEGFIEDITEQKQMEEALAKERNLLHTLIDSSPELIYVKDIESRFLLANKAVLQSMGLTSLDELVGKTDFDFHPKHLAEQYYEAERPVIESGQPMINRQEIIIDQGTGASKWLLSSKVPFRDGQDNIAGLVGLNRDITELKQTERTLREQTILLGGVAEAMRRLLVSTEFETSIIEALEVLGFVTGVDRIYIFETHHHPETKEPLMSQRFIWEQELSEVQIDNSERQNIPYSQGLERWYERLSSNKIVSGLVRNFPPSERAILESRRILSILVVPITVEQHFWGFIGFDDCQDEREWSKEDKSILFAMAGSIGGAIARHQA